MNTFDSFDPMAWAAVNADNQQNAHTDTTVDQPQVGPVALPQPAAPSDGELDKARATTDELLRLGANIADTYDDWVRLGFALADGLGPDGRELYHRLSAQSAKYCEADSEKKWQECLAKHDGRTTIATFYNMAKLAGVDLSRLARQFPSKPSFPHGSQANTGWQPSGVAEGTFLPYNNNVIGVATATTATAQTLQPSREGSEGTEGFAPLDAAEDEEPKVDYTETFSDKIDIDALPSLLADAARTQHDNEGRDKVILGGLTLLSGVMPSTFGLYDRKRVHPPLYCLIDAPTASDKGVLDDCRQLVMPIEWELRAKCEREQDEYRQQKARWDALKKEQKANEPEPVKPPYRSVFVPANSSATATYQALSDNGEQGIMFETEADTLTQALKQDYGNYSDGLRKAFHHETISYNRRKDDEHVYVARPRMAVLLTCTPGQIPGLLSPQQVENGMANRFLFYNLQSRHEWRNVFAECKEPLADKFAKLGQRYLELFHDLEARESKPVEVTLSEEQKQRFNDYFSALLPEQIGLYGEQLDAFVKRLGLSTFRIAMTLTVLRCCDREPRLEPLSQSLVCCDADFQTALTIADCLINHTAHVYTTFLQTDPQASPTPAGVQLSAGERQLYTALPKHYTTTEAREKAERLGIPWKTAERYIGNFVARHHIARRESQGHYAKLY